MIKTKKQMFIVIAIFAFIILLGGTTYAWFSYRREGANQTLIAGNIYLTLEEGNDTISLTNIFPETSSEARSRNDNYLTFEISGINESDKTLYYEIDLNRGASRETPYERFNDEDLRFDLVELDSNGDEVRYLLSNVVYDTLINKKIWVDTIDSGSSTEVSKKYKLRMWLSDEVLISDSDSNRDYYAADFKNHYASIKITVIGDFNEKYFGYQKVQKAILAKQTADPSTCGNITYTDQEDGIVYFSGTNDCVDMNYVWYSGKLWRITAIYPDGAMKLITQNNITSIAFNEDGQVNFYIDANTTSYMYQWLNEDFYSTLYNANQFIDITKQWNATMPADTNVSTKPAETNMITANVGLLNNYDFYNSYRCIYSQLCNSSADNNSYLSIHYVWWLLNSYSASEIGCVRSAGSYNKDNPTYANGVRPSIVLKSGLEFAGDGTTVSPYKIVGDKEVGVSNDLLNTRISGEYIKLKNGGSEQLFRIIGVEDNKTKIIAMDYADNKNTRAFATSNGNANTLWGSGATTGADTWYTYLNAANTGYLDILKNTYGELFDSGLYYLGMSIYNYKLSVCANTTSGSTIVCDKTNDKGTFDIGLSRYGEMFATQQGDGSLSSINMRLMNKYNMLYVWHLNNHGIAKSADPSYVCGARPTLHLKSTVKILSGTGTESDPYVVGL